MSNHPTLLGDPRLNGKSRNSQPQQAKSFDWCYQFRDGSRLVGTFKAYLAPDGNTLLNPTQVQADYISPDGQTVRLSWCDRDFVCFDSTIDGRDMLIVGSNDCFNENSVCLVWGKTRSRSQVTDSGRQLIAESFRHDAWSLTPATSSLPSPQLGLDWSLSPFFPFLTVSLNFWLLNPQTIYQWTFSPYLPFFPCLRVAKAAANV